MDGFLSQYGLIYNPYTKSVETNPMLGYSMDANQGYQASVAQAHNAGLNATEVPGTELSSYHNPSGAAPQFGTTYGQLTGSGYSNVPQGNNLAATQAAQVAKLVSEAQTAYMKANPNQVEGFIASVGAKLGAGPGAEYEQLANQLKSLGIAAPDLGMNPNAAHTAFQAALSNLGSQAASEMGQPQVQPVTQAAPQVPVASPIGSYALSSVGNTPQVPTQDAYSATAPNPASPGQMGANAFYNQVGGH
jgi:hypothetical protein